MDRRLWNVLFSLVFILSCVSCGSHEVTSASANSKSSSVAPLITSGGQQSYADVVDRVAPAVVTIRAALRLRAPKQFPFFDDPFFRQLFGGSSGRPFGNNQPSVAHALGSGVIVNADGHIVTNHHVIDGADQITVELSDRRSFLAKVIGSDAPSDIAVLKIGANNLPVLPLGDSDRVRVGDVCLAVGNPLGIGETVTHGIISAKERSTGLSDGSFEDFLQTDAPINKGNSGGALVNTQAQLIGINSQIISPTGASIGIGFAIPSNMTKSIMDQLTRGKTVHRGKLGVAVQPVTSDLAAALNLKEARGVLINSVDPGSPAERAGLRTGDIITALNGKSVNDPNELRNQIASTPPGSDVTLTILRDGREQQVKAKLAELDTSSESSKGAPAGASHGHLGISVEPLTPELAKQLGLRNGQGVVVADVDPTGPAAEAGVQPGDVILEVNRQPVRSPAEIQAALARTGSRPALLLVNRDGRNFFLTVQPANANG